MSTFDLHRITEALLSSKIKSRNDALNLLAGLSASKLRLHARQFTALASGLVKLIETEKLVYANNSSNPVVARLSTASSFLQDLVEEELKGSKNQRYKLAIALVSSIMGNYFVAAVPLEPCAVAFSHILRQFLLQEFFRSHLTVEAWSRIHKFVVRAIECGLDDPGVAPGNEKTLDNLFVSVLLLLGGDSLLVYLPIYQDKAYFPLLQLATRCLKTYDRRESPVLISCFKLINKLVLLLSTEDCRLCNHLVRHALSSILHFSSSSVEPLMDQFAVFLNMEPVHRCFDVSAMPALVGGENALVENVPHLDHETTELHLYTLGMLIQAVVTRLCSVLGSIGPENIRICEGEAADWFTLSTFQFVSEDPSAWLLLTGLARLIASYYKLRSRYTDIVDEGTHRSVAESFSGSSIQKSKRRKFLDHRTKLWSCDSPVLFYMSLLNNQDDHRTQLCGIQLLAVHCALFEREQTKTNLNLNLKLKLKLKLINETTAWNLNDSTVLDLDFVSSSSSSSLLPSLSVLVRVLSSAANKFWALVCCRSILSCMDLTTSETNQVLAKRLHQTLKLLLPLIKDPVCCTASTSLIVYILLEQSKTSLHTLVDASVQSQLVNITDLADLAGPAKINSHAMKFWWCIASVLRGVLKSEDISLSVSKWFASKWYDRLTVDDAGMRKYSGREMPDLCALQLLLFWLGGRRNCLRVSEGKLRDSLRGLRQYRDIHDELMRYAKLGTFITEQNIGLPHSLKENTQCMYTPLPASPNTVEAIWAQIVDVTTLVINSEENLEALATWTTALSKLLSVVDLSTLPDSKILSTAHEAWEIISQKASTQQDAALISLIVLQFSPSRTVLERVGFPFDFVRERILEFQTTGHLLLERLNDADSDFEDFSSSGEQRSGRQPSFLARQQSSARLSEAETLALFKFCLVHELGDPIRQIALFDPSTASQCIRVYVDYLKSQKLESVSRDSLTRLVRAIGDGPLAEQGFDRSDETIATCCDLLRLLLPIHQEDRAKELRKDCLDLFKYLAQCTLKGLFLTESKVLNFWNLFLCYYVSRVEFEGITKAQLIATFFEDFEDFPNNTKAQISDALSEVLKRSDPSNRMRIYRELFLRFPTPQASVERGATYCLFFCLVTGQSTQLRMIALFNFIECIKFDFFKPYLKGTIGIMSEMSGDKNSRSMFLTSKFELLKSWWQFNHDVLDFPYDLFGFLDRNSFLLDNYRDIVAIVIAIKCESRDNQSIIRKIAQVKQSDVQSLICDSLPLIVPMAYTSEGIRNTVFKTLTEGLHDLYKTYMQQKLPLIVLEIIRFTDFKNERSFASGLASTPHAKCLTSETAVEISQQVVVSPNSSLDLISAVISKYWILEQELFWSQKTVYFLIRQLGKKIFHDNASKIIPLRAIKYVLCLSNIPLSQFELFKLVVDICSEIAEPIIDTDVYILLQLFDKKCLLDVPVQESVITVFKILCMLCEESSLAEKDVFIKEFDTFYSIYHAKFGSANPLIRAALDCCQGTTVTVSHTDFESFLTDQAFHSAIESSSKVVLSFLSCFLKHAIKSKIASPNKDLVKFFWNKDTSMASDDFKLWVSQYLSAFYLSGSFEGDAESILENREFCASEKVEFSKQIGRMDFFLDLLMGDLQSEQYEKVAFVETILGSLMWKYNSGKGDVQKFMNFDQFYPQLQRYIMPLDFHSCVLINSTDDNLDFSTRSLDSFVTSLASLISDSPFETWSCQLLLSVIQELASYTSMASLLASYVLRFHKDSSTVFPKVVCFYISLAGKKGAKKIEGLINAFWKYFRKPYDYQAVEMIKDTIIMVRIGAKVNIDIFKELYASLRKIDLFMMVKEGSFPRTALLLFEDSVEADQSNIDWKSQTANLASIYESLDDEDLFSGLPEDPSVEHALGLISQFGTSAEKVHYSSGLLDASLLLAGSSDRKPFVQSLIADGLLGLSKAVGAENEANQNSYEWAWKLNLWEIPLPEERHGKHDTVYSYFKLIYDSPGRVRDVYEECTLELMDEQKHSSTDKMSAREMRSYAQRWFETLSIIASLNSIFERTDSDFITEARDFGALTLWFENADLEHFEDIIKSRQIAFKLYSNRWEKLNSTLEDFITPTSSPGHDLCLQGFSNEVIRAIDMYRKNHQVQKMVSSTMLLDKLVKSSEFHDKNVHDELLRLSKFHFAKTLWSDGKTSIPVAMLRELEQGGSIELPLRSLNVDISLVLATLVKWLAESRQSLGSNILTLIVDPMKDNIDKITNLHQRAKVFHTLAHFCEQQYKSRNLLEQVDDLTKRVESKRKEVDEIKTHYGRTSVSSAEKKSVQRYYNRLKSQVTSEESELSSLQSKREVFANNAVKFYLNSLLVGDEYIEDMDSFFSLFLELASDHDLQTKIKGDLECLPSFKPLSWSTQLLSRVSSDDSQFQRSVQNLIFRICMDHPFHSLYNLISLIKNEDIARDTSNSMMLARVEAVKKLRERLASKSSQYSSEMLLPIERLCDESVLLSEYKCSKGRKLDLEKLKIGTYWMNELPTIPPPTLAIPVSHSGYAQVPCMVSIDPKVTLATSGLSLPKIATFLLSDGTQHKMLLKHGTDDLRQDATMEQVFEKVNNIFVKDRETRKRHLRVRTYKAVPLGPKAGVIEFVLHSKALIEVIRPYHQKLDALKSDVARAMMKDCQTSGLSERLQVYNKITAQIQPVLHHFFLDNFVTPDAWYESRQIYTRGTAATSMVGHILGLGDRHCNNILLDEFTGEPIHIDLGVAFDQGKRLPIPETVPFRLTRDIVDGFGVTGTKGSFSKLSEHSFRVLRSNKERILAIVDVLRWDPLYLWSISPVRKQKLQDDAFQGMVSHEDGSEASTALLTVVEKLQVGGLSVEATVRELIQEATSVENLAVIYCGWCPFF